MRLILSLLAAIAVLADDRVFTEKVAPVFQRACLPCHDAATHTSGFSVATPEAVLAGGARFGPTALLDILRDLVTRPPRTRSGVQTLRCVLKNLVGGDGIEPPTLSV